MNRLFADRLTKVRTVRHGRVLGLCFLLAACDSLSGMTNSSAPPPCPPVSTLGEAARITHFAEGPGRDLIDIDFTGRIVKLRGKCFYENNSDTSGGLVRVEIIPEFKIERGAANRTRTAEFSYFVSIMDDHGNVLSKQDFPYTAKYWKNKTSVKDFDKPVELTIPFSSGQDGQDFNIYVGFQLTAEELDFNRGETPR